MSTNVIRKTKAICILLLGTILLLPPTNSVALRRQEPSIQSNPLAVQLAEQPNKAHRVFAPHWSTEGSFVTTVYIRNVHINLAITARLSLILEHRTITLPWTSVAAMQTIAIDVAQSLTQNGEKANQSGGAVIDFNAQSAGGISAHAQVLDTTNGLSFTFPFKQDGAFASGPLEAVAWYYSKDTDAFIAMQNTTDATTLATPSIFVSGRTINLGQRRFAPGQIVTVKIPSVGGVG